LATAATSAVTTTPVTIEQAAAILGVSASTIRRRIRAGALRVEETRRPQGVVWLVHLPAGTTVDAPTATVDTAPVTTTATAQPAGDAIAAMIQATLTPIIAPLVAELAASRQANERQAEQLVSQAETIGRQAAELDTLRAAHSSGAARTAPQPVEPTAATRMARVRALAPWLLAVLAIVAVVLPLVRW
jgi:excisionase family DNA binding protein